jgi:hypothetical protein
MEIDPKYKLILSQLTPEQKKVVGEVIELAQDAAVKANMHWPKLTEDAHAWRDYSKELRGN